MKYGHYSDNDLKTFADWPFRCPSWDPLPDGKKNVVILGCSHTWGGGHALDLCDFELKLSSLIYCCFILWSKGKSKGKSKSKKTQKNPKKHELSLKGAKQMHLSYQ